jgi:hypothetical protein
MPRTSHVARFALMLSTLAAAPGCGSSISQSTRPSWVDPEPQPMIEVVNHNYHRIQVAVDLGGQRTLLGEVPAFGSMRFEVPPGLSGAAIRMALLPKGEVQFHKTRYVRYSGAENLRLVIGGDLRESVLAIR